MCPSRHFTDPRRVEWDEFQQSIGEASRNEVGTGGTRLNFLSNCGVRMTPPSRRVCASSGEADRTRLKAPVSVGLNQCVAFV